MSFLNIDKLAGKLLCSDKISHEVAYKTKVGTKENIKKKNNTPDRLVSSTTLDIP